MSIPDDELIWASLAELQTEVKRLRSEKAELLAALEAIAGERPYPEPDDGQEVWDHVDVARAAITKAESK